MIDDRLNPGMILNPEQWQGQPREANVIMGRHDDEEGINDSMSKLQISG